MNLSIEETLLAIEELFSEKNNSFESLSLEHKKLLLNRVSLALHDQGIAVAELQRAYEAHYKLEHREQAESEG